MNIILNDQKRELPAHQGQSVWIKYEKLLQQNRIELQQQNKSMLIAQNQPTKNAQPSSNQEVEEFLWFLFHKLAASIIYKKYTSTTMITRHKAYLMTVKIKTLMISLLTTYQKSKYGFIKQGLY